MAVVTAAGLASPVAAQDQLAPCDPSVGASMCQLPTWPEDALASTPSRFGAVVGDTWMVDDAADVGPGGLDIQAVGIGRVEVEEAGPLRRAEDVLRTGRRNRAVRPGSNAIVRVVLDRPLDQITEGYAGIHVATDIDRSRTNNAPAGVGRAPQPFAGSEDVYSVTHATTTGLTELQDSDLAGGWFRDRDAFAAAWAAPNVVDLLIRPEGLGDELRVVTFTSAADGGYDVVDLGTAGIPVDGAVGLRPSCLAAAISAEPFVVPRLAERGQTVRDVETPASLQVGAAFTVDPSTRDALTAVIAASDTDGDGRSAIESTVALFEDGTTIRQRPMVEIALGGDTDTVQLALEIGLAQRGFDVVRQLTPTNTGDAIVDAWLAGASDALVEALPPFRVARRGGSLVGDLAACGPSLVDPLADDATAGDPGASEAPVELTAEPDAD
jgi:hypothetical protein